jgi:SWI/SNF-related matrix-associated actin-dependent regulator 1 of chromatin subfamily A
MAFVKRYCDAYKGEYGWVADGASNIEELTVQLHGIMLRRTKTEVLDLPPKIRTWLDVEVSSQVARGMSAAVMENLRRASRRTEGTDSEPESPQQRGAALGQLTTARLRLAVAKVRSTLPFIENAIEQGEKVIVFSCFLRPISLLEQRFPGQAVVISGEVGAEERQRRADLFQQDEQIRLMVANINAGGVGLNLTAARQVVFNDLDWVPTNHWQAEDRAFRIGQQHAVNVTYMVASGTVDEFVRTVLETKASLIDQLIEGKASPQDMVQDVMGEMRRLIGEMDADTSPSCLAAQTVKPSL